MLPEHLTNHLINELNYKQFILHLWLGMTGSPTQKIFHCYFGFIPSIVKKLRLNVNRGHHVFILVSNKSSLNVA